MSDENNEDGTEEVQFGENRSANGDGDNNGSLFTMMHQMNSGSRIRNNNITFDRRQNTMGGTSRSRSNIETQEEDEDMMDEDRETFLNSHTATVEEPERSRSTENGSSSGRGIRRRPSFVPHDLNCSRTRRIFSKSTQVDLQTLERGQDLYLNPPQGVNVNRMLLTGQLMWIVTPGKDESSSTYSYYKRSQAKNTTGCLYNRILFFRFVSEKSSSQNNRLFCVVHLNMKKNHVFFDRFANERDNGFFSIGSMVSIVNPDPIEDYMNGTPMITSNEKAILLQPMVHVPVSISSDLEALESKAFVINRSIVSVGRTVFLDSPCSGKFCDRQNIETTRFKSKSCGCFSLKSSRSNIISVHSITFTTSSGERKMMPKFSSLRFMELFTKGKLSIDVRASRLQTGSEIYDEILDSIEDIVDLINDDGGWVIYGWGKQGVINDIVMLGNDAAKDKGENKVLAQTMQTHIVHLHPVKKEYLDPTCEKGRALENMKYDFSTL